MPPKPDPTSFLGQRMSASLAFRQMTERGPSAIRSLKLGIVCTAIRPIHRKQAPPADAGACQGGAATPQRAAAPGLRTLIHRRTHLPHAFRRQMAEPVVSLLCCPARASDVRMRDLGGEVIPWGLAALMMWDLAAAADADGEKRGVCVARVGLVDNLWRPTVRV
jgi:hypothetical protein